MKLLSHMAVLLLLFIFVPAQQTKEHPTIYLGQLMKLLNTLFVIFAIASATVFAQKDAKDSKKAETWPVEIRANLMITDSSGKYVDNIKAENIKLYEDDVEQRITYFVKKEPAAHIAFVMDNTGSLRTQFDMAVAIPKVITANLGPVDDAMVVRFVSRDKITLDQRWTRRKDLLNKTFDDMYIEGGQSAIVDGVYLAAAKVLERAKNEKDKRFAVVLVTDGEDRDSYYAMEDLFSLIGGTDIQIFVIALSSNPSIGFIAPSKKTIAEKLVRTLAVRSGGTAYVFNEKHTENDLEAAIKELWTELRSQYVIGYSSTNQDHNGKPRRLRVEIADGPRGEKRMGTFRNSFVVPSY